MYKIDSGRSVRVSQEYWLVPFFFLHIFALTVRKGNVRAGICPVGCVRGQFIRGGMSREGSVLSLYDPPSARSHEIRLTALLSQCILYRVAP